MSDFYVPRRDLAQAIIDRIRPDPILGNHSGLFLAAPRRTGKSTFLRRDLMPLLEEAGNVTIYVDLWADRDADPGRLIADAIAAKLDSLSSRIAKAARALTPKSVTVGGVEVVLDSASGGRTATLGQALSMIGERTGRDVALVIDEAQHALSSTAGLDAIFALKAARDEMNQRSTGQRLSLVFTGSHRDKLAGFVRSHRDPFYGAEVTDFPKLGRPYLQALVGALNERLARDNQLDLDDVEQAFALLGHQPELLQRVLKDHAMGEQGSHGLHRTVRDRADDLRQLRWDQHRSDYGTLSDLQKVVLSLLCDEGPAFAPFAEATLARMSTRADRAVSAPDVQKALNALRDKSIVWSPGRGLYALEDQDMREWLLTD
ncbi:AAA family ATPase [Anianabacter salinae]|uniref:AAA family ATPase n=1 Tax=Anianabacter salinae TaxID=2851023 RepID=UPI00225E1806|nr:AAA family ATPase [Anianabacter salinae]MBV0910797.1 ATP-binding protein [Anianabacter salinae]